MPGRVPPHPTPLCRGCVLLRTPGGDTRGEFGPQPEGSSSPSSQAGRDGARGARAREKTLREGWEGTGTPAVGAPVIGTRTAQNRDTASLMSMHIIRGETGEGRKSRQAYYKDGRNEQIK